MSAHYDSAVVALRTGSESHWVGMSVALPDRCIGTVTRVARTEDNRIEYRLRCSHGSAYFIGSMPASTGPTR